MKKEHFIAKQLGRLAKPSDDPTQPATPLTREEFDAQYEVVPCEWSEENRTGWKTVKKNAAAPTMTEE